jgi:hypothetical protein
MEKEKKVWKQVDGWNSIFFYKADVRWIYIRYQVSKHGKRDDNEGIVVQPV